jgi:hypothetical protein
MLGLLRGAPQAQHTIGHSQQSALGNRVTAPITGSVGPLVKLGQSALGASQGYLQRAPHADLGEPADRLHRAVPDALAEPLSRPALRSPRQYAQSLARVVSAGLELSPDRITMKAV